AQGLSNTAGSANDHIHPTSAKRAGLSRRHFGREKHLFVAAARVPRDLWTLSMCWFSDNRRDSLVYVSCADFANVKTRSLDLRIFAPNRSDQTRYCGAIWFLSTR